MRENLTDYARLGLVVTAILVGTVTVRAARRWAGMASADTPHRAVKLTLAKATPPKELHDRFRSVLQPTVIRLLEKGKPFYDFWFRKQIPLAREPSPDEFALSAVKEGTVLGVLKVYQQRYDFRRDEIPPGLYVVRLGFQPEDGDHVGTSPTQTFALLVPADRDRKQTGLPDYKELMKASSTINAAEHPSNLNLQPAKQKGDRFPRLASHGGGKHKVVYLRVPGKVVGGKKRAMLTFALVYDGIGDF